MMMISPTLRLALLRARAAGVRQYAIARRLNLHPTLVSQLVNGSIPIRRDDPRVAKLAEALGVPLDEAIVSVESSEASRG